MFTCAIIDSVKIRKISSIKRGQWLVKPVLAGSMQLWLINNGSLTTRLQKRYMHFLVKPISIKYAKPIANEATVLGMARYEKVLIREVLLMGDDKAVVFAHSILPRASLRGAWNGLGRQGNIPLGATLFANKKVKRSQLSYKKLPRHHPISMRLAKHMQLLPAPLWARRSIFVLNCAKIMVTEVFLPQLLSSVIAAKVEI